MLLRQKRKTCQINPSTAFTYEELMKFWLEFSEKLKAKGKGGDARYSQQI